VKGVDMETGI